MEVYFSLFHGKYMRINKIKMTNKQQTMSCSCGSSDRVTTLLRLLHVLIVNLLLSVRRTVCQWWTCQFWWQMANANQAAWCWAVSTGPIRGCRALMPPSVSDSLVRDMLRRSLLEVIFRALAVFLQLLHTKEKILVLLLGCCPSTAHNGLSAGALSLLEDTANLLCICTYGCAILDEPDYLSNLDGLQLLPHAASIEKGSNKMQN